MEIAGLRGTGLPNPSSETKFSGSNGEMEISIFPVQLTTSMIGNLTRLIDTLARCDDNIDTYCRRNGHPVCLRCDEKIVFTLITQASAGLLAASLRLLGHRVFHFPPPIHRAVEDIGAGHH